MLTLTFFFSNLFCTNWIEPFKPKLSKEFNKAKINDEYSYEQFSKQLEELILNNNEWKNDRSCKHEFKPLLHRLSHMSTVTDKLNSNESYGIYTSRDGNVDTNIGLVRVKTSNHFPYHFNQFSSLNKWDGNKTSILGIIGVPKEGKNFIAITKLVGKEFKSIPGIVSTSELDQYKESYLILVFF